jgi:hypothetical protein
LASGRVQRYYGRIGFVPWLLPSGTGRWVVGSRILWLVMATVAAILAVGQGIMLLTHLRSGDVPAAAGRCLGFMVCGAVGAMAMRWWTIAARREAA